MGVQLIKRRLVTDTRGTFERLLEDAWMLPSDAGVHIQQVNRVLTRSTGTVRGMHLQLPPVSETKIVSCVQGQVFDVVVDLRIDSATFGEWWGTELSESNALTAVIPPGCAHGLQTLTPDVQMLYLHTARYCPSAEAGLNPLSTELGIRWPREVTKVSDRDRRESRSVDWFRSQQW